MCCLKPGSCFHFVTESTLILFLSFFRSFNVRKATIDDLQGVKMLVETLSLNEEIWNDSKIFAEARKDPVSVCCRYTFNSVLRSGLYSGLK